MAISATLSIVSPIPTSPTCHVFDIKSLDADTTGTFNHTLTGLLTGEIPIGWITPSTSTIALAAAFGVVFTATQFTVTKQNAANSGGGVPGTTVVAQVVVLAPHSIL
jgi:hypothetical protein